MPDIDPLATSTPSGARDPDHTSLQSAWEAARPIQAFLDTLAQSDPVAANFF